VIAKPQQREGHGPLGVVAPLSGGGGGGNANPTNCTRYGLVFNSGGAPPPRGGGGAPPYRPPGGHLVPIGGFALSRPPPPLNGATTPSGPWPSLCWGFAITLRHITLGRTPLDEWSARRKDLYLTIHNTHKKQTSMPPAGFESTIQANERPQTDVSDRAVTGIGRYLCWQWTVSLLSYPITSKFSAQGVQLTFCIRSVTFNRDTGPF
jgi:hypothetical protein